MPAKSKSQQRLFGMVHAYNKGELRAPSSLRKRVAALSKHISGEDARHFAQTPHSGLPEKKAQVVLLPEDVQRLYGKLPAVSYQQALTPVARSERRRSLLGSAWRGAGLGAAVFGIGTGAFGAFLAHRASRGESVSPLELARRLSVAGFKSGLFGAGHGAALGAVGGLGLNIFDRLREDS